jgi:glycosyltransferase involved in cell wall biosynthesis
MKPCFLLNEFNRGGAERLVLDVATELSTFDGISPVVVVGNDNGELRSEFDCRNFPTHSLDVDITVSSIQHSIRKFSSLLNVIEPDIVHSHLPFSHIVGRISAWSQSIPSVSTYHNVSAHKTIPKRLAEITTSPLGKRIICVSQGVADSYHSIRQKEVIYNGICVDDFASTIKSVDPADIDDAKGKTVFLNVARCVHQKRQQDLIDAMNHLDSDQNHLIIVGSGPLKQELVQQAEQQGLSGCISITGYVEDIEPYFAAADIFISSSVKEGLPTTHLEAMASQLPIVSTNIPGVNEIVEQGTNGYLVPPKQPQQLAEKMELLNSSPEQLGTNGLAIVKDRFSIKAVSAQHHQLYSDILET